MKAPYSDMFSQFYQPIMNIGDGSISHYEVLLRPKDGSSLSNISILQYISSIEKTGEIEMLDRWNVQEMARKMESPFHAYGYPCSINLSPQTIQNPTFCEYLDEVMSTMKNPRRLHFEITETSEIIDFNKVNEFIKIAKKYGSEVAMDDFGSGFSSLDALKKLDVDIIKIDQMYVKDCLKNEEHRSFISETVIYAKNNKKKVVAEYVENPAIEKLLQKMGVECGQGYYYGKAEQRPESHSQIMSNIHSRDDNLKIESKFKIESGLIK